MKTKRKRGWGWRSPSMPPLNSKPGATWGAYKLAADGWWKLNPDYKDKP